jgi:glycosyltransferase involved in cell wall biosynthesis
MARLVDFYLPAYLERFDRLLFFSSRKESIADFTSDPTLRRRVCVVPPGTRLDGRLAALGRVVAHSRLDECSVLRALQAPGGLPALASRVPLVVTYGYSYLDVSRFVGRRRVVEAARQLTLTGVLRAVLRKAHVTLITNPVLEDEARRFGARRIVSIPNGVPLGMFTPPFGETELRYDVVLLGRLSNEKNPGLVARAAARLDRPIRVCLVGDGPLREQLQDEFARSGCDADFLGTRPFTELPAILRSSAVFVLPSATEGLAKALLEAMACGLPCVVSDIAAFGDIVSTGAVLPFPPQDDRELARILSELLADPERRALQGRRGRAYVEASASLESSLVEETDMLASVVDEVVRLRRAA